MSEHTDDQQQQQPDIADLRRAADEGSRAKRELEMVKAGVDTDSPLGKMFASAYNGELTRDAIKAAWDEIVPQVPPAVEVEAEAAQAVDQAAADAAVAAQAEAQLRQDQARRGIASTPADPLEPPKPESRIHKAYDNFDRDLASGMSREDASIGVFKEIIDAGAAHAAGAEGGDARMVWDGWTPEELEEGRVSRVR